MQSRDLATLEYSAVQQRLAVHAAFSASEDLALKLAPSVDKDEIFRRQGVTREARQLYVKDNSKGIGGARDVRESARHAEQGIVLEPSVLLDVKYTLISSRNLSRFFIETATEFPHLAQIATACATDTGLISQISKTLNDRGEVKNTASDKLARIRRDLQVARERLTSRMERMLSDPKIATMLQEPIVTQREGRFVLPLRAEFKNKIEAVVHDRSASGATLFIEPLKMVELNNQVRELELAERDEVRRILSELSAKIGEMSEAIHETVDALAELDLAFAKAKYAEVIAATEPHFSKPDDQRVRLINARHPLLDQETVVAIDVIMQNGIRTLVITGPNTGGKTVSLKTVGLLCLMAQAGLQIPVDAGSTIPVFQSIFADIGDEQSIEQSLSTFSGHISNIVRILAEVDGQSLVLLDELGAGTDPQEGAVLAQAIMDWLVQKKVTALIATHFPELKAYATATPGVVNASVEFDLETLGPTYHLSIGIPGRSNALSIASRLGLNKQIIEQARSGISPEDLRIDDLLDQIRRENDAARQTRTELDQQRSEVKRIRQELDRRLLEIDEERRAILTQARKQAADDLRHVGEEVERIQRRLERAGQPLKVVEQVKEETEELLEKVQEPVQRADLLSREGFELGDHVMLESLNARGIVMEIAREHVEVQVGRLRVRARSNELTRLERVPEPEIQSKVVTPAPVEEQPLEFEIRGMIIADALEVLEQRLDAAFLAGMPFLRVIHGKGTGKLRDAVRQYLQSNEYVQSFEPGSPAEGGEGVTVVHLAV
jgi:DNA mismatch repair protein MutS2